MTVPIRPRWSGAHRQENSAHPTPGRVGTVVCFVCVSDASCGSAALRDDRLPLRGTVLQVSGRASFELVQKCHLAGIPVLAAVSAPSSLAADLAEEVGITLVGFSRGDRATVYTHPERVEA